MSPKWTTLVVVALTVLVADQTSKAWIVANVDPYEPIEVIAGFFRLTHARNPGALLGIARGVPYWVFVGLTVAALALIGSFLRQIDAADRLSAASLSLIVGGALGNLADRVFRGEVVDFLQFDLGMFLFPDFNVADASIIVGVGLLLLDVVTQEAEEGAGDAPSEATGSAKPDDSG